MRHPARSGDARRASFISTREAVMSPHSVSTREGAPECPNIFRWRLKSLPLIIHVCANPILADVRAMSLFNSNLPVGDTWTSGWDHMNRRGRVVGWIGQVFWQLAVNGLLR